MLEVRDAVDPRRLLDLAGALISFPSENPPGNERGAAEYLANYCKELGLAVRMPEASPGRPNVLARWESQKPGPHLIFNGHLDVVPAGEGWTIAPFQPTVRDGRLYGRGAADMKGGVAAMVSAVEAVRRVGAPLRGTITLAAVADEEEDGGGTRQLIRDGLRGDWAIVPEATELKPVIAHKGSVCLEVTLRGSAAHSSTPQYGVNAIYKAARLLEALERLDDRLRQRQHPLLGYPTLSVGTIRGGLTARIVPAECDLSIDRRTLPGERAEDVMAEVQAVLDDLARGDPEFAAALSISTVSPAMEIEPDTAVVTALCAATEVVLGQAPGIHGWSAACDAGILVQDAHIPTVIFGPGSIARDAHRPDESVAVDDLVKAAQIFALTVVSLLEVAA